MRKHLSSERLFLVFGIAGALLSFAAEGSSANELEHLRKQSVVMRLTEGLWDPEITGSISVPSETVWIDVTRPTWCKAQGRSRIAGRDNPRPVSVC